MPSLDRAGPLLTTLLRPILVCALLVGVIGCGGKKKTTRQELLSSHYQVLPPKQVPEYLKDTVLERCDLMNAQPFPVSGFGLVANLRGTGDTFAGTAVREYIRSTAIKRGFGSRQLGFENMQPEEILKDPRFAIVRIDGFIPPGARKHQRFDIYVSTLEGNNTTSLAHGDLYRTDLKVNGANVQMPGYSVDIWATGEGSIFVNPAYAMYGNSADPQARTSLRRGLVLDGGITMMDRPLLLRLRQPQLSMARGIEYRIDAAFQNTNVAAAKDEGIVWLYVPDKYGNDWEHFVQVALHQFLNSAPDFAVVKARQLAEEAVKPDAPLLDISYCWEALGPLALPFFAPLMTHQSPEVAFAAARAGAFLGDGAAQSVLMEMARSGGHPFRISAVQTLAKLPASPVINQMLRTLLDSSESLVRLEAYRALAANGDSSIISRPIGGQKFMLDLVPSQGPPLIYASRTGVPRIALIGHKLQMSLPVLFTAMDNRLSISSERDRPLVTVYYRGPELPKPVSFLSSPDLAELISRLGGEGAPGEAKLSFNYCDVVSLLQAMSDQQRLSALAGGKPQPVSFVLQEPPRSEQTIEEAPMIPEQPPATDKLGAAVDSGTK